MTYKFKYKRSFFWHCITVVGHTVDNDIMVLYLKNGGLRTIKKWSECELKLGLDWVLATKQNLDNKTGIDLKLNIEK